MKTALGYDRFMAGKLDRRVTGVGRRRAYADSISMPQTCRSNWHAIQQTTKRVMAGHQESFATGSNTDVQRQAGTRYLLTTARLKLNAGDRIG